MMGETTEVALPDDPGGLADGRAEAFDGVVLGSHSGGLIDRPFVGNVAETVARESPVPVSGVR